MGTNIGPESNTLLIDLVQGWVDGSRDGQTWEEPVALDFLAEVLDEVLNGDNSPSWLGTPEDLRYSPELRASVAGYLEFLKAKGRCARGDGAGGPIMAETRRQARAGAERAILCRKVRVAAAGAPLDDLLVALRDDPMLGQMVGRQVWRAIRRRDEDGRDNDNRRYANDVISDVIGHFVVLVLAGKLQPAPPVTDRRIIAYLGTIAARTSRKALAMANGGSQMVNEVDWLDGLEGTGPIETDAWCLNRSAAAISWLEEGAPKVAYLNYIASIRRRVSRKREDLIEDVASKMRRTFEEIEAWLDEANRVLMTRAIIRLSEEKLLNGIEKRVALRSLAGDRAWEIKRALDIDLDEVKRHRTKARALLRGLWPVP